MVATSQASHPVPEDPVIKNIKNYIPAFFHFDQNPFT
jgi:hypothetical protein